MRISDWSSDVCSSDLLAPEMVERAARDPRLAGTFFTRDGEWPCFEGQWFDLIISSLAFQWFDNLTGALERLYALLRPGGSILFSTMAERSFAEWRAVHERFGLTAGTPHYPSLEVLQKLARDFPKSEQRCVGKGGFSTCRSRGSPVH